MRQLEIFEPLFGMFGEAIEIEHQKVHSKQKCRKQLHTCAFLCHKIHIKHFAITRARLLKASLKLTISFKLSFNNHVKCCSKICKRKDFGVIFLTLCVSPRIVASVDGEGLPWRSTRTKTGTRCH